MKLCWGLIMKSEILWVKFLRAQYECGDNFILVTIKKKSSNSLNWQAITAVWEIFMKGIGKKIKGGQNTKFWWEPWTMFDKPLKDLATKNLELINAEDTVIGMTSSNRLTGKS